jgi:hypothetical protein
VSALLHRRIVVFLIIVGFLFIISGTGTSGETTAAEMSAKYGDGPHVAYAFNNNYTAYGLGRGASQEEAAQRAKENCSGAGCGENESGVYMPGCIAMFRLPDGTYKKLSRMSKLTEEKALKIGKSKFGEGCQLEIVLCSN